MTDMPELIYLYDRGVPRGMQVVYGGTRIVGDTEYTRSDTIQALRESNVSLLEVAEDLYDNYITMVCNSYNMTLEQVTGDPVVKKWKDTIDQVSDMMEKL